MVGSLSSGWDCLPGFRLQLVSSCVALGKLFNTEASVFSNIWIIRGPIWGFLYRFC